MFSVSFFKLPDLVLSIFYKFQKRHVNQIWWEGWNCMQPLGDMTFDHMITKLRTLYLNFYKDTITKLGWNTWQHCFMSRDLLYSFMSFLCVMWSRNLSKLHSLTSKKTITTKLGGNTYKNERVVYLHITWANHSKVIKATAPKVALMKGINLNRPRDFWLYDILTNKKSICNFYKSC